MQIMITIRAVQRILNTSFWNAKGFYIIKKGVGLTSAARGRSEEKNQKKGSKKSFKEKKK